MARGRRIIRRLGGCLVALFVLAVGFLFLTDTGRSIRTVWSRFIESGALSSQDNRKYDASTRANLRALYTALMLYHESEGQFPQSNGWMDAIENRLVPSDMDRSEGDKKLVSPSLAGKPGEYGYAMNDSVSGKYKGDVKDPKTPLIFDSSDTERNAHGSPKKLLPVPPRPGGNYGVTVDGTIVKL